MQAPASRSCQLGGLGLAARALEKDFSRGWDMGRLIVEMKRKQNYGAQSSRGYGKIKHPPLWGTREGYLGPV